MTEQPQPEPKQDSPTSPQTPAAKPAVAPPELSASGLAIAAAVADLGLALSGARADHAGNATFDVDPSDLLDVARALHDRLGLTFLSCLTPLDWPDRWEIVYHLYDFVRKGWAVLKTKIPKDQLRISSVTGIWPAANWYEREGYDMYGIEFDGHPQLCRILMSDDWQTFPLRKDHPMDMEGGY